MLSDAAASCNYNTKHTTPIDIFLETRLAIEYDRLLIPDKNVLRFHFYIMIVKVMVSSLFTR